MWEIQTAFWRHPHPPLAAPLAAPPAYPGRRGRPAGAAHSQAERGLDTRLGMGEGSASEVPWGDGLGKGDWERLSPSVSTTGVIGHRPGPSLYLEAVASLSAIGPMF